MLLWWWRWYTECFHMTSRRPCWCLNLILFGLNHLLSCKHFLSFFLSFFLSSFPINLHGCWQYWWKRFIAFSSSLSSGKAENHSRCQSTSAFGQHWPNTCLSRIQQQEAENPGPSLIVCTSSEPDSRSDFSQRSRFVCAKQKNPGPRLGTRLAEKLLPS